MSPTPNRMSSIVACAVVCALFSLVAQPTAQQSAPQPALPDVQKLGPQVGTRVPDFTLLDQKGQSRTLASLMGPKGLMLVFYRSADWCPYCKTQLAELPDANGGSAKSGIGLAAVSYDAVPILADFSKRRGITFPLLSDPGSATIKRYGILNTTVPETNQQSYGIPFPGTFMLNTQGVVTSRFFEQAYQERSTVGSIMARLGNKVDVQATTRVIPATRVDLVCDRQHGCPRDAILSGPRCAASARSSRVRARRHRVQADRVVGRGAARSRDAWCAVSAVGGLPFQAVERTRAGLSAAVSDRAGRADRRVAPGPQRH